MLTGASHAPVLARCAIQSASPQSYVRSAMTDAVSGGCSLCAANGSAFSSAYPSCV